MAKRIRLNERDLKQIIKESVIRFLNENTDEALDTPERALKAFKAAKADKEAHPGRGKNSPDPAIRTRRGRQMDTFGSKAADLMNQEIGDPNLLVLGDRGARRMYYANGPYSAYINNDAEDLDSIRLYSDTYQEGDEPLTIANLPDDERERIHRGFEKFRGFHNSPDASLEESNESQLNNLISEAVKNVLNEISTSLLGRAADSAHRDMIRNWNDSEIRGKREMQWKKFNKEKIRKGEEEKNSVCPSVPESELVNMPRNTYVIMDGDGRDAISANFKTRYSGRAGTKEQCEEYVKRFYDANSNWEYLPSILSLEEYFKYKH